MDYHLEDSRAFVAAGAHGIGRAVADLLAREGATVVVADIDGDALADRQGWAGTITADLATPSGVAFTVGQVLERFDGPPDILISNLGVGNATSLDDLGDDQWARSIDVNLLGTARLCRGLVPAMADRGSGAVVVTGSDLAKQPEPGFIDYGTCKAGLLYLTKALAKQYAPTVRVNTVLPGPIWSRMWTRPGGIVDQLVEQYGTDRDEAVRRFLHDRQMPMGIGQPEDVAHAVVFLASPLAKFITGAGLDIGGTIRGLL